MHVKSAHVINVTSIKANYGRFEKELHLGKDAVEGERHFNLFIPVLNSP